ncbi:MAG TPA: LCP family protein [Acidimicrobiia bacterium]|nr:LCP family protein [Acidimicrobiia bacterium]
MLSQSSLYSFLRRFAIAFVAVVILAAVGVVAGKAYGRKKFAESTTIHIPDGVLAPVRQGEPANYLLIGSDTRQFVDNPQEAQAFGSSSQVSGARSDVMMVLHVEPQNHTGMLVSLPRDLVVNIPGHGRNLLNAAYDFGGPTLTIQTIETDFPPLKINHYLEVDFLGFRNIVNAIGHIHIWFPSPVNDEFTGLHIASAGCASLNGDEALAYARSRHYNIPRDWNNPAPWRPTGAEKTSVGWIEDPLSDLDRIPRQQYFLRTISQAAIDKTGSDPLKISDLLDAVFKNFSHDQNLSYDELTTLALTFRGLNPARVQMMTLPVVQAPYPGWSAHVIVKEPDATTVLDRLASFPVPKPFIPAVLAAPKVSVRVVNGSGVKGAAARALDTLTAAGFRSAGTAADADRSDYAKTQIRYAPGKFVQGFTVAFAMGTSNLVEAASAQNTLGGDVLVIVGRDYNQLKTHYDKLPSATTSTTGVSSAPTSSTSTTTTTLPRSNVDPRFVPVDPRTGAALVGCPTH